MKKVLIGFVEMMVLAVKSGVRSSANKQEDSMKKVLIGLMIGLVATLAFAVTNDGHALIAEGKYAEAQAVFEQRVQDVKGDHNQTKGAVALLYVGFCQMWQRQYKAADETFVKVLEDYPKSAPDILAKAVYHHGEMLSILNEPADANDAYVTCATDYVQVLGAKDEASIVWRAFEKINPNLMSVAEYKAAIESILKATRAVEDNARFLGRLKSELEKIK